ncbi:MAG: hypothetical protein ABJC13_20650 [Acidobacteriota bacterium]
MRSLKTRVVLLALFPLLGFASTSRALTSAEVACEEARLGRLVHRMATNGPGMNLYLWPAGPDRYAGLGVYPLFVGLVRRDWQMGFDLQLSPGSALLNPRRSLLPQAVLARNDLLTTPFHSPEEEVRIDVSLELAPRVVDPTRPTHGILISSQIGSSGSASGASRSLAAENLFERCSADGPSAFDLQVFEILSRTFRVTDALKQPFPGPGLERYKTIFFRDVEPLTYRAKVFSYLVACDPECGYGEGSFQFRLRFTIDAAGTLAVGRIEALPWCLENDPLPCSGSLDPDYAVLVAPPIFAGHEQQTEAQFRSGAFLNAEYLASPNNILTDDVPWPELLRGTAWDRPLAVAPH